MLERSLILLTFAAAIGNGVVAGIFFAFSSFVMPAIGRVLGLLVTAMLAAMLLGRARSGPSREEA